MNGWMILWSLLLVGGVVGMAGLLIGISVGAIEELKESLHDLLSDRSEDSSN